MMRRIAGVLVSSRASRRSIVAVAQQRPAVAVAASPAAVVRALTGSTISSVRIQPPPVSGLPQRRTLASAVAVDGGEGEGDGESGQPVKRETEKRRRRPTRNRPVPITLTDRAAAHLTRLLASKPDKVGVRLGVRRRGCNGMSYTLKYADEIPKGDEVIIIPTPAPTEPAVAAEEEATAARSGSAMAGGADRKLKLFVDPMATLYIAGTVMDWEETELASEFTFRNPNAKGECGCGESFNV